MFPYCDTPHWLFTPQISNLDTDIPCKFDNCGHCEIHFSEETKQFGSNVVAIFSKAKKEPTNENIDEAQKALDSLRVRYYTSHMASLHRMYPNMSCSERKCHARQLAAGESLIIRLQHQWLLLQRNQKKD